MNEEDRKRLTVYLEETQNCFCNCKEYPLPHTHNRSFATWTDLGVLFEKIVEKGEWTIFMNFAKGEFEIETSHSRDHVREYYNDFTHWLQNPARFCSLVAEWLKEKEKR